MSERKAGLNDPSHYPSCVHLSVLADRGEILMKPKWENLADWLEDQQQLILAERTESIAERELEALIELGEYARVEKVCREALERLPK